MSYPARAEGLGEYDKFELSHNATEKKILVVQKAKANFSTDGSRKFAQTSKISQSQVA